MDFELDGDDVAVAETFDRFFERESTMDVVRSAEPSGFDRALWTKLTALGAPGVAIAVEDGGATLGQLAAIAEAAGTRLAPVPVVESLAAVRSLAGSGYASSSAFEPLASGESIASVAMIPIDRRPTQQVPAGAVADAVVGVFEGRLVVADRADHDVHPYGAVHGSIPMAEWTFDAAKLRDAESSLPADAGVRLWKVLMASALVGLTQRSLDLGAEYATQRKAFGQLIGTFQGVSHPLADGITACDGARLLVQKASRTIDTDGAPNARLAAMAFAFATETARSSTKVSTHIHGGYGASTEVDAQLCHSRAIAWPAFAPSPSAEYAAIGSALIGQGALR
jgi:alkylation response protein AidB-like acyl-CoA dehydrogenase